MPINKAALDQAAAARKKYRQDTPTSLYSIEGEDAVFIGAYLEALGQPASQGEPWCIEHYPNKCKCNEQADGCAAYHNFLDYELDGSQNITRTPAQYNDILAAFKAGTRYGTTKRESVSLTEEEAVKTMDGFIRHWSCTDLVEATAKLLERIELRRRG